MSYSKFSTKNANYWLVYSCHLKVNKEPIFSEKQIKTLDAIVLESGATDLLEKDGIEKLLKFNQYSYIIKNALKQEKMPLFYFTDVKLTPLGFWTSIFLDDAVPILIFYSGVCGARNKKIKRRKFLSYAFKGIGALALLKLFTPMVSCYVGVTNSKAENLPKFISEINYVVPTPIAEFRNAVTAKKLEDFIAPKLYKELGRKPNIAIVFGAAHAGIKEDLLNKHRRERIIHLMKKLEKKFKNYRLLKDTDIVVELQFKNKKEAIIKTYRAVGFYEKKK